MSGDEVKDRASFVLTWVQLLLIIAGLGAAGFVLGIVLFDQDFSRRHLTEALFFIAGFPTAGLVAALFLATLSYIMLGTFRVLPLWKRGVQWLAILAIPLLVLTAVRVFFLFTAEPHVEKQQSTTVSPEASEEDESEPQRFTTEQYGLRRALFTHNETGNVMACQTQAGGSDHICVTVLDGWFIATATWEVDCVPNTEIAPEVHCTDMGTIGYTTLRVERPEWDSPSDNLDWSFNSSGFMVDVDFGYWQNDWRLNELRRVDAAQASKRVERLDAAKVARVAEAFMYQP